MKNQPIEIIDLNDLSLSERTASYILPAEKPTIIETSASPSIPYLLAGLKRLHIKPEDIVYIIVTHIHLDHAGGVGLLLESCPNATVIVHPRGERHLADPSRLIAGAKAIYGNSFSELFDPILPVPNHRLVVKADLDTLDLGGDRILTFYDTPGHAKHHLSIHDSLTNAIFTGDTLGILYPTSMTNGTELILPSTSPNQFDPNAMLSSMKRVRELNVNTIYFGHYGKSDYPDHVYHQLAEWLNRYLKISERIVEKHSHADFETLSELVAEALFNRVEIESDISDPTVFDYIRFDLTICAQGIVEYLLNKKD
ncbi:Metallo-beta-lactamase superfamily protein [Amphibacillus marinus]|uniref:Metallo-beta-lactamase superfamily protein n=1 Tax=Amphibacillus marinus TaxID=872970 RepID=A0A1H8QHP7_9BACI|nr:MBL fold metallo-hydrolase [Amphibacillus marinus]SEO53531.1 Metallo-beta-lactamase superfamily protein [Amphibacillus marinus]